MPRQPTICTLCEGMTAARQYIRVVPAWAHPDDVPNKRPGPIRTGDRLRFHIRHTPEEMVKAVTVIDYLPGEVPEMYKLNYNPPWQLTTNKIVREFVKPADLLEAITVVRDRTFEFMTTFDPRTLLEVTAGLACSGDDGALADMLTIYEKKDPAEIMEKCLSHSAIERLQAIARDPVPALG